ncbi:FAD/FMN-containing dehydrogenase [bacterium A37T11]|nr:FAD/FMN-containing dehydrogenase [bacterium A37T11]
MDAAKLRGLASMLAGELFTDRKNRLLYATDASAYAELPLAVAIPHTVDDLKTLITFASREGTSLIPRTAGTSLAGQVVGSGIVVDLSRHFTQILELNSEERWVRVQPGVVRDELNRFLKPYGLFFGPETSTANRAMIGGMVGNNSCGSNSVVYRSTREHTLEVTALLSDGSEAVFKALTFDEFIAKCAENTMEASLYRSIRTQLSNYENQQEIRLQFPKRRIDRRNTGYAIDLLLDTAPFTAGGEDFNFCKLLAGSEGTLALITEIKLNLELLPPPFSGLLCVHFHGLEQALQANLIALNFQPGAVELIDHYILECTRDNMEQRENRFFVQGDPAALLVIEFFGETMEEVNHKVRQTEAAMRAEGLGYYFPLLIGSESNRVWSLRKAGLGLLSNLPGDEKAVPVIEDAAVDVHDLPNYVRDVDQLLKKYNLYSVHYAHAGSGELHLRPIINLKTEEGNKLFRTVAQEVAQLVKSYQGSLSGEHGDGRLRGEFIPLMIGEKNYQLLKSIKQTWDPGGIFNPGKIIHTPPMNSMLRYTPGQKHPAIETIFRYPGQDVLQHVEQCNGSGDCRKSHLAGGTMCPSYMATHKEGDTTRARANILRNFLTHSNQQNRFDHREIKEVMDLCISCKGCKSECPSTVDMAKLKAEFLQHYQDANGVPLRSRLIANNYVLSKLGAVFPGLYNYLMTGRGISTLLKRIAGFASERSLPTLHRHTLRSWYTVYKRQADRPNVFKKQVYLFCDEFSNYQDVEIGVKAIRLLEILGYEVLLTAHTESGRAAVSKGLLRKAKQIADKNVRLLSPLVSEESPLIGIEPSAILSFRDEYPDLVAESFMEGAQKLAKHSFLIDEFLAQEIKEGKIQKEQFTDKHKTIKFHGHCQQKAWQAASASEQILSFPINYQVQSIASGCCGMAGSFGYEKEHYYLSMQIGELVLLPEVRRQGKEVIIAATGTSCRHQIKDGSGRKALHPVEILFDAINPIHA